MNSKKIALTVVGAAALAAWIPAKSWVGTAGAADMTCGNLGTHPSHTQNSRVHSALTCDACHEQVCSAAPTPNVVFGELAYAGGASPVWDESTRSCANVYCHGPNVVPLDWTYRDPAGAVNCSLCHGSPPSSSPHTALTTRCNDCHSSTVLADGTIDVAGGYHINGQVDATGCTGCHEFPPASGAHVAHSGQVDGTSVAGNDVMTLQDRYPNGTPTTAPAVYGFGCAHCHPIAATNHNDGNVDVLLYEATAPVETLKARSSPTAAYDTASKTCSGVYCHSSGQEAPAYKATPGWFSGTAAGCSDCHSNPPAYPSGGAGTATANSHLNLADDGYEFGHFLGMPGAWHTSKHGGNWGPGQDTTPITCQTCHYDTTDPSNTGPSGFYYLDTTGYYRMPGGDPGRISWGWQDGIQCSACHAPESETAPTGTGKVLPLRHVNGTRDVVFDSRTTLPAVPWLPAAPNAPTLPYWVTDPGLAGYWPAGLTWNGTTLSFSLNDSAYDPATKTCTNVACHVAEQQPVWGRPYQYYTNSSATCYTCHPM